VQFSELQKPRDLDLDLVSDRGHTDEHIRSRSTHTPNYIKIGKLFIDVRSYGRTDTRLQYCKSIRSSPGDDLKID